MYGVTALTVFVVMSREANRMHYFRSVQFMFKDVGYSFAPGKLQFGIKGDIF